MLGCPVCNDKPKQKSGYAFHAHKPLGGEKFKGYGCGHEFSLFEALRSDCRGFFGIIGVYAPWQWHDDMTITVGKLETLPVPVEEGIELFAGFLTPSALKDGTGVHYIPKFLNLTGPKILFSTVGVLTATAAELGTEMPLGAMVFGYPAAGAEPWKKILYEGLTDFSEQRAQPALFKLAQSLELYCDRLIYVYLTKKLVKEALTEQLFKSGRNWAARRDRILSIAPDYIGGTELEGFKKSMSGFYEKIRPLRNSYAHEGLGEIKMDIVKEAYELSFPILWGLERMRQALA